MESFNKLRNSINDLTVTWYKKLSPYVKCSKAGNKAGPVLECTEVPKPLSLILLVSCIIM